MYYVNAAQVVVGDDSDCLIDLEESEKIHGYAMKVVVVVIEGGDAVRMLAILVLAEIGASEKGLEVILVLALEVCIRHRPRCLHH